MRNKEKDEAEKERRKQYVMEVGFHLFAEKGIERVTMPEIADASGVARPSLYRYFASKLELVIAIGTWKWKEYIDWHESTLSPEEQNRMTAAEYLRWYMDSFIDLYRNHADLLRFNYFFNSFLNNEVATPEQSKPYLDIIDRLGINFHELYKKGQKDGTIRKDIPEECMFSSSFHIMLAAVTRYAVGLVYKGMDHDQELNMLKNALLHEFSREA